MSEHKKIVSMFWWVVFFEREAAVVGMAMARTYTAKNWNAAISILKPDLCYIWIFLNKVQFPPFTCGSIDSVYLPILDRDLAEMDTIWSKVISFGVIFCFKLHYIKRVYLILEATIKSDFYVLTY